MTASTGDSSKRRVLIVEDSRHIAELLSLHLQDMHCETDWAPDGIAGLKLAQAASYDLVILDLMLPLLDGMEICRRMRHQTTYVPILMLTAKSSEVDRVCGLEMGADDYLTKPFSIHELLARVKAIFRRVDAARASDVDTPNRQLRVGDVEIVLDRRTVTVAEKKVELTVKEFDLLIEFMRNPGVVYSRSKLFDRVWGYGHIGHEHTVNSYINRLRGKIERDPRNPEYILTVWGVGYKFAPDSEQ